MLFFSSFAKVKYTGPTIALSLAVALAAALTLAPAMLAWLGDMIFWPFRAPHHSKGTSRELESLQALPMKGIWVGIANLVVGHPAAILSICLAILVPLAIVGAGTKSNHNQLADLDPDRLSVIGARVVERYFAVGELGPAVALIRNPGMDFRSDSGRAAIETMTRRLSLIENVADVRSLTSPLGLARPRPPAAGGGILSGLTSRMVNNATQTRYVSTNAAHESDRNHITRFDVVFKADPFSATSMTALESVLGTLQSATAASQPLSGTNVIGCRDRRPPLAT